MATDLINSMQGLGGRWGKWGTGLRSKIEGSATKPSHGEKNIAMFLNDFNDFKVKTNAKNTTDQNINILNKDQIITVVFPLLPQVPIWLSMVLLPIPILIF